MNPDYTPKHANFKQRFDFEIGYLVRSPCKECCNRIDFPGCMEACRRLEAIHSILAEVVSCSRGA